MNIGLQIAHVVGTLCIASLTGICVHLRSKAKGYTKGFADGKETGFHSGRIQGYTKCIDEIGKETNETDNTDCGQ